MNKLFILLLFSLIIKKQNSLNVTNFTIENGSIIYKRQNIYEAKCSTGYTLNSLTPFINFDFINDKWVPVDGYLDKNSSLCSKICKIKINGNLLVNGLHDSSLNTVILNDNSTINLKCKTNSSIIKTTFQQESISNEIEIKCNNEMRSLNTEFEFKCLDVCNVNYLLNLMRNEDNIGKFYPINPLNQFYLTHESIRFYCNSLEYDRKVILFECLNSNWYFATKNEALNNNKQLINECAYDNEESAPATTITSTNEFYFKKNFKSLLNLKLNLKLFLVILLITSSLIILFLMLLLGITFYKRYRLNNYYRSLFTTSSHNNDRFSFLNSLFRRHDQRQLQGQENFRRGYDDQLTIGSSSSLNNNNLINQNISLPTYDEAINKPTHQQFESIETSTTGVVAAAAIISPQSSPPPSFSTILKETCSNVQSRNDDSQSNYSSISAAIPHNKKIKQLRFGSINSHHYLNDSNENFSLNGASSSIAASAITTSEVCTIITNDSTESKFVLRGSFENNIDQTSLFNYSTSLSNAILNSNNQEVEPLIYSNQSENQNNSQIFKE